MAHLFGAIRDVWKGTGVEGWAWPIPQHTAVAPGISWNMNAGLTKVVPRPTAGHDLPPRPPRSELHSTALHHVQRTHQQCCVTCSLLIRIRLKSNTRISNHV